MPCTVFLEAGNANLLLCLLQDGFESFVCYITHDCNVKMSLKTFFGGKEPKKSLFLWERDLFWFWQKSCAWQCFSIYLVLGSLESDLQCIFKLIQFFYGLQSSIIWEDFDFAFLTLVSLFQIGLLNFSFIFRIYFILFFIATRLNYYLKASRL